MSASVGVVCTFGRIARRPAVADSYLVAEGVRATWFDGQDEVTRIVDRPAGRLVAVAAGEADEAATAAIGAVSFVHVLVKLWSARPSTNPAHDMHAFLRKAHGRMRDKLVARQLEVGASGAVAWQLGRRLVWAEIGTARVWLLRGDQLRRLGLGWREGEAQRFLAGSHGLGDDDAIHLRTDVNTGEALLEPGDRVVVATSGLWEKVDRAMLREILIHVNDPQTAAVAAMERAVARGSVSPITAVILDVAGDEVEPSVAPPAGVQTVSVFTHHDDVVHVPQRPEDDDALLDDRPSLFPSEDPGTTEEAAPPAAVLAPEDAPPRPPRRGPPPRRDRG